MTSTPRQRQIDLRGALGTHCSHSSGTRRHRCVELCVADVHPSATRRNVITEGIDLNSLVGQEFEIQGVRFAGVEECRLCFWMNNAFRHEQAESWLKGHGGLRARILTDGGLTLLGGCGWW